MRPKRPHRARHQAARARMKRLAVPPAYQDVLYASDAARASCRPSGAMPPAACNIAIHPSGPRCARAARRGSCSASSRRCRVSGARRPSIWARRTGRAAFALSAVIELVIQHGDPAGSEAMPRRTARAAPRSAESNIDVDGANITLKFRAKGGKDVEKEFSLSARAGAIGVSAASGRRMFQYRDEGRCGAHRDGKHVNEFLRRDRRRKNFAQDLRTLSASAAALEVLAHIEPAASSVDGGARCAMPARPSSEASVEYADDRAQELRGTRPSWRRSRAASCGASRRRSSAAARRRAGAVAGEASRG